MTQQIPPVAVLVKHRVADYDTWKRAFDKHQSAREQAGWFGHHINRGAEDPNLVYIYGPATDADRLKRFIDDGELRETMANAGVEGPPSMTYMKPMSADFIPDQKLAGLIVTHDVEDYDTWRAAYDDFDGYRKDHGIVGHAVNQVLGNPKQVIVYHQANDLDTIRAFVDSDELKDRMKKAGVAGPPTFEFVQVADFADY
jgi:hypothetical protein